MLLCFLTVHVGIGVLIEVSSIPFLFIDVNVAGYYEANISVRHIRLSHAGMDFVCVTLNTTRLLFLLNLFQTTCL